MVPLLHHTKVSTDRDRERGRWGYRPLHFEPSRYVGLRRRHACDLFVKCSEWLKHWSCCCEHTRDTTLMRYQISPSHSLSSAAEERQSGIPRNATVNALLSGWDPSKGALPGSDDELSILVFVDRTAWDDIEMIEMTLRWAGDEMWPKTAQSNLFSLSSDDSNDFGSSQRSVFCVLFTLFLRPDRVTPRLRDMPDLVDDNGGE